MRKVIIGAVILGILAIIFLGESSFEAENTTKEQQQASSFSVVIPSTSTTASTLAE